ncbi:MAG TPA: Ig-like domain-containing protein [Bacteroidota bacterium]
MSTAACCLPAFALAAAMLGAGCAGQIAPPGGPVDTIPPRIVRTVPDSNATRVTAPAIELEFSKYVDRRTVEESIFISPPVGTMEFDWSGRTVGITFAEPLRKDRTYVVNVGTDVADVRAGNKMARGYTLAFSTGDSIDRGSITGKVFDEKPAGVMIFAYALHGMNPDTLDPTRTKPDYIMQTGADGTYQLSHLAFGRYRVMAVRDEYHNLLYDRQIDAYGVWRSDPETTPAHPEVREVSFRLTKEDTTRPFLTSARAVDRRQIAVRFSEPVDTLRLAQASLSAADTLSGQPLPRLLWFLDFNQPAEAGIITAAPMDSGKTFRVRAAGFVDEAGNRVDSLHGFADFSSSAVPDTLRPVLSLSVRDSARDVPQGAPVLLAFSTPVLQAPVAGALRLTDSTRAQVPWDLRWRGALAAALVPRQGLMPAAWYTLSIVLDSLHGYIGRGYSDSVRVVRFRTGDLRSTGTIEGTVGGPASWQGPVRVTASSVDLSTPTKRAVGLRRPGPFLIDGIPEGRYRLDAFADVDSSGAYRYGLPHPFRPSAPFGVGPDSVKVRARWGVQGVSIELR